MERNGTGAFENAWNGTERRRSTVPFRSVPRCSFTIKNHTRSGKNTRVYQRIRPRQPAKDAMLAMWALLFEGFALATFALWALPFRARYARAVGTTVLRSLRSHGRHYRFALATLA